MEVLAGQLRWFHLGWSRQSLSQMMQKKAQIPCRIPTQILVKVKTRHQKLQMAMTS
jgi:hypothetical protein